MEKHILLLLFIPCLSLAKVPYYYYDQPPPSPQYYHTGSPHISHAPLGAFHYTNHHNESELYPSPGLYTDCQVGSYCTVDSFCTVNVTISLVALNLTEEEKDDRGKLIPCLHVESQTIEVCCNIPADEPSVEEKQEIQDNRQCPRIPRAFSESSCSDVASTCGSVGYSDPACPNSELCCFDGCANRCISDLSPDPEEASSASETISNFLSTSQSHTYHTLPHRNYPGYYYPYYQPQNPYTPPTYRHSTSSRPFHVFQSRITSSPVYTSTTTTTTTTARASPQVYSQYSRPSTYEHFPSNPYSYQQSFGYVRPSSSKTHEALTQSSSYPAYAEKPRPVTPQRDYSYNSYYGQSYTPYTPEVSSYVTAVPSRGAPSHEICPSALKCIPKKNCDFSGVIVSHVVSTSPEFDTVRVPLLPCNNDQPGETSVCCRDPNYINSYSQY